MLNGKRVKKYKTVVQMSNLNPYWNTSFKIPVNPVDIQNIELHVGYNLKLELYNKFICELKILFPQIYVNDFDKFGGNDTIGWLCFSLTDKTTAGKKLEFQKLTYFPLFHSFPSTYKLGTHWREAISQPKTNITKWHPLQPLEEK